MEGDTPYQIIQGSDYSIIIYQNTSVELTNNDNVDVEVVFNNGERYTATMFTLRTIQSLMDTYTRSGECHHGTYFWASDMIIVKDMSIGSIQETIQSMIACHELETACTKTIQED